MTDEDEGRCRFRCRTNREAFIAGFAAGMAHVIVPNKLKEEFTERDFKAAQRDYRDWRAENER